MTITQKKIIFIFIWLVTLSLGPIAVLEITPPSLIQTSPGVLISVIQRMTGLMAFTLLFWQIILGSFMHRLIDKLGGWIFSFHVFEGILVYSLILLHPTFFMVLRYFAQKGIDPFYVFTDICLICSNTYELFFSLGRISLWLITVSVLAGLFRTSNVWLRLNWKKLHILNYLSFVLISIHSLGVGQDIGTFPFSWFHGPAMAIIACVILYKMFKFVKSLTPSKR